MEESSNCLVLAPRQEMSSVMNRQADEGATLSTLPPELLSHIVAHLETASALVNFASTCKKMQNFVQEDGFKVFAQKRFQYLKVPQRPSSSFWRDTVHGMTTLSRSWDRKAFLAWNIGALPPATNQGDRRQRGYFRAGQTMGFVPVIDSYESWYGGDWSARKEVVAWGAGRSLIMRIKVFGKQAKQIQNSKPSERSGDRNAHGHRIQWAKYHGSEAVEGRDDITSVNVLPQRMQVDGEQVIVGRASGGLSLIYVSAKMPQSNEKRVCFATNGRPVRSATVNPRGDLLAACLSDTDVALYQLSSCKTEVSAVSEGSLTVSTPNKQGRTWCSRFLSANRLAVGHGAAATPIRVYDVGRGYSLDEDARQVSLFDKDSSIDHRVENLDSGRADATSVYSLAPLSPTSFAGGVGDLFLSGAYDGCIR